MGDGNAGRWLRGAAWGCLFALWLGCGGAAPVVETRPVPVERVEPASADEPWGVRPLFGYGVASRVSGSPGDAMQILLDGMRVEVAGDELRWADTITLEPMYCGTHVEGRYYFSTVSGAVYAADSFLGPLERLRDGGPDLTSCLIRFGVHSVKSGPGDLLLVGPEDRIARLPEAMRGHVVDAAFRSPTKGIVVLAPGVAMLTTDGERYTPVDVGGRMVMESWPEPERWVLVTDDGPFAIDDEGNATALQGEFEPTYSEVPEEVAARVKQATLAIEPLLWSDFGPGVDGRTVVLRMEERDGRERPAMPLHLWSPEGGLEPVPPTGPDECRVLDWGGRAVAVCEDALSLFEGGEWRPLGTVGRTFALAIDGSAIATTEVCAAGDDPAVHDRTLCLYDGERWHARVLEEPVRVVDAWGDRVLARSGSGWTHRVLSISDPSADQTLELDGSFRRWFARFDADGGVWGVARSEEGLVGLRGAAGEPLVPIVTPEGLQHFRMVDARHGMAIGESLGEVFVTDDGAETWEPLDLGTIGDASTIDLPGGPASRPSSFLVCGASGCVVGHLFLWGAPVALEAAAPAAPLLVTPVSGVRWPRWHRQRAGTTELRCLLPPADDGPGMGPGEEVSSVGEVSIDPYADRPELRWAFHEVGRAFSDSTARIPETMLEPLRDDTARFDPLHLTGRFAIVDWCSIPPDTAEPDPVPTCGEPHRVRAGAEPERLELKLPEGFRPYFAGALPLPGGATALRFVHQPSYGPVYDVVAVLGRDGRVAERRVYVTPRGGFVRFLAVRGRDAGLAIGGPEVDTLVFHSVDAAREPSDLGAYPTEPLPICRRAPGRTGTVALGDGRSLGLRLVLGEGGEMGPPPGGHHSAVVALDGADSCLAGFAPRAPRGWQEEYIGPPDPWIELELRRGALRARTVSTEGASDPVECTLAAP